MWSETDERRAVIDYRDVSITRRELTVLKDITLKVMPSEMVYLMGRVGSGKSSLLKTMYAEVPIEECGTARVLGHDMTRLRRRDIPALRRQIGIVFQDFRLLNDRSVYANLDFVLRATKWKDRGERQRRIERVLEMVDMTDKGYKMPWELSGGEQQRIVIARALLNEPPLLLADEPTGNLDPDAAVDIVKRLHTIASMGTAVIMATHNAQLVEQFPARTCFITRKSLLSDRQ